MLEGEMPKMRWEKTGTTHHGFSGKNFKKELVRAESRFQMTKFKYHGGK